jgi:hypothetical protein
MMTILSAKHASAWRLIAAVLGVLTSTATFAGAAMSGTMKPLGSVRFAQDKDVPCLLSGLETGEPAAGRSTWILKAPAGCVVPWHSHTAGEQLIAIRGAVLAEMTDHPPTRLGPGGFAAMGTRMPHQFTCVGKTGCVMIVSFDGPYDIRWGKGG